METPLVAFERPRPDPELRPAYVRLPDAVRVNARAGRSRVVIRIPREVVEQRLMLDRPAQWRDLDAVWHEIEEAAEESILAQRYAPEADDRTGLPVVAIAGQQLRGSAGKRR